MKLKNNLRFATMISLTIFVPVIFRLVNAPGLGPQPGILTNNTDGLNCHLITRSTKPMANY